MESKVDIRLERIESKLELQSKDYTYTNKRVDDTIERVGDTNKIVAQIDANYQSLISKLIDVINTPKTITQ